MRRTRNSVLNSLLLLLVLGLLAGLTWANHRFALQFSGGRAFYPQWKATRLLLTRGWSPYSERTSSAILNQAPEGIFFDGTLPPTFQYPVYATILFSPYSLLGDYNWARALWMTTLETGMVFLTFCGIRLARLHTSNWLLTLIFIFSLTWYHGVRAIVMGSPAIIVACLIAGAFLAIRSNLDPLAGFLLAMATIKPLMVILLLIYVLLWSVLNRRGSISGVMLGSVILFVTAPMVFQPDWVLANLGQSLAEINAGGLFTPRAIFKTWLPGAGNQLGWGLTIVLGLLLIFEWRNAIGKSFNWFIWTAFVTLTISPLIGVRSVTENYVLLLPGLLLIFASWRERWPRGGNLMIFITMVGLLVGLWKVFLETLGTAGVLENPVMFFLFPVTLLVGLYWIRWWATRPPRVYLEQLRSNMNNIL